MKYSDVINNGLFQGRPVDEDLFVQLYEHGLITDDDYIAHVGEFKPEFKRVMRVRRFGYVAFLIAFLGLAFLVWYAWEVFHTGNAIIDILVAL